jgi:hypothetical protein
MTSPTQVILTASSDWLEWFQLIETAAVNTEIWDYVNPNVAKDIIPTCTEPEEPTYHTVNRAATTFRDLEPLEREELRDLRSNFKRKYTVYRKQKVALSNLVKRIQETIDHKHYCLLRGIHTPHGMLTALKERFSLDEDKRYYPNQPYLEELFHVSVPGKRVILDIPDFRTRNEASEDDYLEDDDEEDDYLDDDNDEEDTDVQDSNLQSDEDPGVEKPSEFTPIHQLLTPSTTSSPRPLITKSPFHLHDDTSHESDNDEDYSSSRHVAYVTDQKVLDDPPGIYTAFATGTIARNQPLIANGTHREQFLTEQRAPYLWLKKLINKLTKMGLRQISKEPFLFINDFIFLIFFIDDIIILFHRDNQSKANFFKKSLPGYYVEKIADRFDFRTVKLPKTPIITDTFEKYLATTTHDIHVFQQTIGSPREWRPSSQSIL